MSRDGHERKTRNAEGKLPRRLLRRERAATYLDISPASFDNMRKDGKIPAPKVMGNFVVWDSVELDQFVDQLPYEGDRPTDFGWDN